MRLALPTPDADAAAHSARLVARVREHIVAARGFLPFDQYMQLALYAPGLGYYTAGARKFGAAGDFVTAPELSPWFARALAVQVAQVLRAAGPTVLEFGAGSGALAAQLLPALDALGAAPSRYLILEPSPELRERQRERLAAFGARVAWIDAPPAAFAGCALANEVLDAMPVTAFERRAGATLERGVSLTGEDALILAARPAPAALAADVAALEAESGPWPADYASEIGYPARAWMRGVADWLARGVLLAIDYGFPAREFYHPQRVRGTLVAHYRHHAVDDPLLWPGLADLTAHVDFSAMAEAAHGAGLEVLGYATQARFLLDCGLPALLESATAAERVAAHRLISEAEMGELFKVLAVGRGVDLDLLGFASGDRRGRL
ncbi:MAG TPA: SAM-dependent methyltransferase [Burkholderiaceae bacterium]|nr:SAM-dependent methyltransferase [Burkholderiaceae bacterium]